MKARPKFIAVLVAAAIAALGGCAALEEPAASDLAPRRIAEVRGAGGGSQRTVAVVLGGGGLRGFAHVGVLAALEEAGIRPDLVVGTSAGAVVGAAYASGMAPARIRSAALGLELASLLDFTWRRGGWIRGESLAHWIDTITAGVPIEQFPVRFAAVATDLRSGEAMVIEQGPAGRAVQASSAVPGMNVPIDYPGGQLVDGGVTSLVPVRVARALGADVVIAVDVYCQGPRADGSRIPTIVSRVMQTQSCLLAAADLSEADLVIAPAVAAPALFAGSAHEHTIAEGYKAARKALQELSGPLHGRDG